MDIYQINGAELANFFIGGSAFLTANKEQVNALNVFPVPDGDTGTNMGLTMSSAVRDILGKSKVSDVAGAVANGALMGARGNSGVILSQIFRGFGQGLEGKAVCTSMDFAKAIQKGVDLAYKSVMRPVEGTILTVSKEMGKAAIKIVSNTENVEIIELIKLTIQAGKKALDNTPNQLPALKEAGVVDAGGMGLLCIFEGGLKALLGEEFTVEDFAPAKPAFSVDSCVDDKSDLKYCYCTEFFIHGANIDVDVIRKNLANMGDSQVIVGNEKLIKTHIHTDNPGAVLAYVIQFGSLHDLKIENMKDQHRETIEFTPEEVSWAAQEFVAEPEILAECGVVAVACGEGMCQIFTEMGVNNIISGGQSMNPSAEEIVNAINKTAAKEVVVLPNNSNIILAAEQAQKLTEKPVFIVPTKFLTQGLAAMMSFDAYVSGEENVEAMTESIGDVKSAQVTYAVRDSAFNGNKICEGDILGLIEGKIVSAEKTIQQVMLSILSEMVTAEDSLITLLYGEDVTPEAAEALSKTVEAAFPDLEIETQMGGQSVYYYLVSVE